METRDIQKIKGKLLHGLDNVNVGKDRKMRTYRNSLEVGTLNVCAIFVMGH